VRIEKSAILNPAVRNHADGGVFYFLSIKASMDSSESITEKELRERLADQYAQLARLTGSLAHEIKNPLSTIVLNMELLAEDFAKPETPREKRIAAKVQMVQRECRRLQSILDDFLSYAKIRRFNFEPTDLNEELRKLLEFYRPQAEEHRIEIIPYLRSDLPTILLDREQFRGALLNLILNAQQAMPDGGQLVVATDTTPRGACLHLIDTGLGMDEKTLARIFEAFYSTKPGGTGLGLPTTGKIIEAHGGTITCQSEPGRGTRFTIELPTLRRLGDEPASDAVELPTIDVAPNSVQ
jgi:signal transduction histidine kinase